MKKGQQLKDRGIQQAEASANKKSQDWSKRADETLCAFIRRRRSNFRTEEFREYAEQQGLPTPPSLRAFGGVILRAAKSRLIKQVDIVKVKNPRAHQANAALWKVC